ncbi:MAG: A24 family peptidase [Nitrosopumilus sp.]|nr:A24 family peptidase [Nitrosopumilus sp.]
METVVESLRIVLFVSMLGIAGICDVKSREIPDVIWLIFGGIGAALYIWDYDDGMTSYHVIAIFTSVFVGIMLWRWKIAGSADAFAILAMAVILPVHYEFVMMPIMILVTAFLLVVILVILYNVSLNISDIIRSRKMNVFFEFSEPKHKKVFAFLTIHKKRKYEKFVIPAENFISITPGIKSFVFLSSRNKIKRNSQLESNEMHVQNVPPLISYMFGVALFLLLPEILSILFS